MKHLSKLIMASAAAALLATPLAYAQPVDPNSPMHRPGGNPIGTPGTPAGPSQHGTETIREVQQALKAKGLEPGPVDGVMGPKTKAAVQEFQQKQGLSGSGQLNRETLAALDVRASASMDSHSGARPSQSGSDSRTSSPSGMSPETNRSAAPDSSQTGPSDPATTKRP